MRVLNRTPWRTDHLRAFVREVAKRRVDLSRTQRKQLVIEFRSSRTRGVAGHAYYRLVRWSSGPLRRYGWCRYVRITLPTGSLSPRRERFLARWVPSPDLVAATTAIRDTRAKWETGETPDKRALAAVLEHEIRHTLGERHPGTRGSHVMRGHYDDRSLKPYEWAADMLLERT